MIREDIISLLDKEPETSVLYDQLKYAVQSDSPWNFDKFFAGCISSLFYKPNHTALVLAGKEGIGKSFFVRNLLPKSLQSHAHTCQCSRIKESSRSKFFIETEINFNSCLDSKNITSFLLSDDFIIYENGNEYPVCDKRLASLIITTNVKDIPQRKTLDVMKIKSIDFRSFNSIDKLCLWIEIFNRFKPDQTYKPKNMAHD